MTQEERDLLFIELSARLHYGVKVQTSLFENPTSIKGIAEDECWIYCDEDNYEWIDIEEVKPYLRPMSSMTEEERRYLLEELGFDEDLENGELNDFGSYVYRSVNVLSLFDWMFAHHFDFRGLIEKGLALEAPEGMYKTE